ncbi:MAG: hypothetical protein J7M24_00785, partial [Candidatus Latescibacteria bacterium]|nr:hypothetical protein [Candidatus Latescibacterota bacterium]
MVRRFLMLVAGAAIIVSFSSAATGETPEGTAWVEKYGYTGLIELSNASTTAVLEPNCGGRVIEYSLNGKNVLYVDPEQNGWTYTPGGERIGPCAGRFDIGPEKTGPPRVMLWLGKWEAKITGPRKARMTSVEDTSSGVQLIRDFELDAKTSRLSCTQTIRNISGDTKQYFHWSRTFAEGNGICVVPVTGESRFPEGYIIYQPARSPDCMNFRPPEFPGTSVRDGFLEIADTPPFPKFGLDSTAGWFAYITKSDLLFVKKFHVFPDRVYGEMASLTVSIWYVDGRCELEPIGPRENLRPGGSASFTEEWWLLDYEYPA